MGFAKNLATIARDTMNSRKTKRLFSKNNHLLAPLAYYFQVGDDDCADAVYIPALNHVWIDASAEKEDIPALLDHETFHAYVSGLQPAHLLPLRGFIDKEDDYIGARRFEDISEALCEVALPARLGVVPEADSFPDKGKASLVLSKKIILSSHKLARLSEGFETFEEALYEAVLGVAFLLSHVVPFKILAGSTVIDCIDRIKLPKWHNRWELFFALHRGLIRMLDRKKRLQKHFRVALHADAHRFLGDLLVFLDQILSAPHQKIVECFPSILDLASLGSFFVMPILRFQEKKRVYAAKATLVHSTSRGESKIRQIYQTQSAEFERSRRNGTPCVAAQLFTETLDLFRPFRTSNENNRVSQSMKAFVSHLPRMFHLMSPRTFSCPGCQVCFNTPSLISAYGILSSRNKNDFKSLIAAAEEHEDWLLKTSPELIKESLPVFEKPITIKKEYKYL